MLDASALGACMYVPATHPSLLEIAEGRKLGAIRSVIFCTEDAVLEREMPSALVNMARALSGLRKRDGVHRFVRVRSPAVLSEVLAMTGAGALDGFVLPKISHHNFSSYLRVLGDSRQQLMPTLETREAFHERDMLRLLRQLDRSDVRDRVVCLRIGGNDLLSLIGMRRPRGRTIYETPIGLTISRLVTLFKPNGFHLSAPVFEYMDDMETLSREVSEDLNHGLTGKTAIHPSQVPFIERHYKVLAADVLAAHCVLDEGSRAVFDHEGSMCEPATHRNWARAVLSNAKAFGSWDANAVERCDHSLP